MVGTIANETSGVGKCVKETVYDQNRNPISHITVGRRMTDVTRRSCK
jgi:hypothetical protein